MITKPIIFKYYGKYIKILFLSRFMHIYPPIYIYTILWYWLNENIFASTAYLFGKYFSKGIKWNTISLIPTHKVFVFHIILPQKEKENLILVYVKYHLVLFLQSIKLYKYIYYNKYQKSNNKMTDMCFFLWKQIKVLYKINKMSYFQNKVYTL